MIKTKVFPQKCSFEPVISVTEKDVDGQPVLYWVIDINIPIFQPGYYSQAINVLLQAKEQDTVHILINTNGGSVSTCLAMINAMLRCRAHLITDIVGYAYSSGAYIWAFGKELRMGRFARAMFHASSHGDFARTRDIKERAEAFEAGTAYLLDRVVARGILTEEEKTMMLEGKKDVYFTFDDLKDRMDNIGGSEA